MATPTAGEAGAGHRSPYLTLAEAAYCRRTAKTLSNHKAQGRLRAVPGTRPPLFQVEELDKWLSGRPRH